jgi:folate-binding protein YgfZ
MALLADRGVVLVKGTDAGKLLQGLVTNDLELLSIERPDRLPPAMHAGLLSPQGKILFDFFVVAPLHRGMGPSKDLFWLETTKDNVAPLIKRLTLYKLRADVAIEDASEDYLVVALWGAPAAELEAIPPVVFDASPSHFEDPRLSSLGMRWLVWRGLEDKLLDAARRSAKLVEVDAAEYHTHRVALGVPEGGKDYAFGDAFPHEADFDQLHGVSFTKGCFVGQEVVSRMQHRANVRKRVVPVEAEAELTPGSEVKAGAVTIGAIGSAAGARALALVRLDRAAEAKVKGEPLTAGGVAIRLSRPEWAKFEIAPAVAAEAP